MRDLKFSQRYRWRLKYSKMWGRVGWYTATYRRIAESASSEPSGPESPSSRVYFILCCPHNSRPCALRLHKTCSHFRLGFQMTYSPAVRRTKKTVQQSSSVTPFLRTSVVIAKKKKCLSTMTCLPILILMQIEVVT